MSVYPFVEAEKVAERNVASACALMEVSRSAFYGWHHHEAGPRALADAKLEAKIVEIHRASRATRHTAHRGSPPPWLMKEPASAESVSPGLWLGAVWPAAPDRARSEPPSPIRELARR
jgi:hypothetical protein